MAEARPLDLGGVLPLHRDSTPAVLNLNCSFSPSAVVPARLDAAPKVLCKFMLVPPIFLAVWRWSHQPRSETALLCRFQTISRSHFYHILII